MRWKRFVRENKWQLISLVVVGFLVYVSSLGNEFVSDDIYGIVNRDWSDFSQVWRSPLAMLGPLEYWLVNAVFGKAPVVYRLINVMFHIGTALVGYGLVARLWDKRVALLAGLLFVAHPLQSEAVVWISGGVYSQAGFFGLLSLWLFVLGLEDKKHYRWSLFFLVLALQMMKRMVVIVGVMGLVLVYLKKFKQEWKKLIAPGLVGLVWFGLGVAGVGVRVRQLESGFGNKVGFYNPLVQIPVAVAEYLKLMVWPKALTLYHSDLRFSGWQYGVRAVVTVGFLVGLGWSWFKNRKVFFWGAFFCLILAPSLMPLGIGWVVAERYVYLASLGIYVPVAAAVVRLSEKEGWWEPVMVLFGVVILILGVRTVVRSRDWRSADALWLSAAKYSRFSPQNHNNLGDYYGRQGDFKRAIEHFERAIELREGYADAYHNLGNTYLRIGELENAEENFRQALEYKPGLWQSYLQLGMVEGQKENWGKAEEYIKKAKDEGGGGAGLWLNLAMVYKNQGRDKEAMEVVDEVLRADVDNEVARELKRKWR